MPNYQCDVFTMKPSVSSDFSVPMPTWDNTDENIKKDLQVFNMWEGELEVVDKGLNAEPLTIGGIWVDCGQWWDGVCFPICFPICFPTENLCDRVEKIWEIMNDGEEITIDDLSECLNGVYIIESFSFDTIKRMPNAFKYSFTLQKVRDL